MDPVKEAFQRAKQDISEIKEQISQLKEEITSLRDIIQQSNTPTNQQTNQQSSPIQQTNQQINPTDKLNEPNEMGLYGLKTPYTSISIGNRGVPTNKQTNQQTDRQQTDNQIHEENPQKIQFQRVTELISSLDQIKQEVRLKFKKLTKQEMLVFSAIYQLEEQNSLVDYPLLSSKLALSESSIRDYTQRIIKKGIPLDKINENNKKIYLKISPDLKKIASLNTILQLREL